MSIDDERRAALTSQEIDFLKQAQGLPLIDEEIEVLPGIVFQRPNSTLLAILSGIDTRIRYVAADPTKIVPPIGSQDAFNESTQDQLSVQILKDFPDDSDQLELRGITVSLRDEFPCFPPHKYSSSTDNPFERSPFVDNALTILRKGMTGNGELTSNQTQRLYDGSVGYFPQKFMYEHTIQAIKDAVGQGKTVESDNLFPGILVYHRQTLNNWQNILPENRIVAVYITDRVIDKRPLR